MYHKLVKSGTHHCYNIMSLHYLYFTFTSPYFSDLQMVDSVITILQRLFSVPPSSVQVYLQDSSSYEEGRIVTLICSIGKVRPASDISFSWRNGSHTSSPMTNGKPTQNADGETYRVSASASVTLTRYDNGRRDLLCEVIWMRMYYPKAINTAPIVHCKNLVVVCNWSLYDMLPEIMCSFTGHIKPSMVFSSINIFIDLVYWW